jgi:enoyl-CoA hydratase/carnithine racemase
MSEFVHVDSDGTIATIRLDRPPLNALNAQLQDEIAAAAAHVDQCAGMRSFIENGPGKATFTGR